MFNWVDWIRDIILKNLAGEMKAVKAQLTQVKAELKKVKTRLDRLESKHADYQDELRARRVAALQRELAFVERIEKIEKQCGIGDI